MCLENVKSPLLFVNVCHKELGDEGKRSQRGGKDNSTAGTNDIMAQPGGDETVRFEVEIRAGGAEEESETSPSRQSR